MQFSLRQMFLAMIWFALAFSIVGTVARLRGLLEGPNESISFGLFAAASPMMVCMCIGGGIGTLMHEPGWGFFRGFQCGVLLYALGPPIALVGYWLLSWLGVL